MKRSLMKLTLVCLVSLLVFPAIASAVDEPPEIITTPEQLLAIITYVTNFVFTAVMLIAVLFIILAAFYFLTAGGNPDTITKARQMLIYALIGIAVALLAKGLPVLIETLLGSV